MPTSTHGRRSLLAATVPALVLSLLPVVPAAASSEPPAGPAPGSAAAMPVPVETTKPLKIVQLGDSYSAGNGAGDYYGPKGCFRSTSSYARKYVEALSPAYNVTFVNRACSGGVLHDLTNTRSMDGDEFLLFFDGDVSDATAAASVSNEDCGTAYPGDELVDPEVLYSEYDSLGDRTRVDFVCTRKMAPQWDAVDDTTDLVLLTIGGNDLNFTDIVKQCFALGYRDPHECKAKIDTANSKLDRLKNDLAEFLSGLKERMRSDAQIVLLSYPLLEKDEDLTLGTRVSTPVASFGTSYAVGKEVRALGRLGDVAQQAAVEVVNQTAGARVTFEDGIKPAFAGHEPDGRATHRNSERWLHEFDSTTMEEWYHYNDDGHSAVSSILSAHGSYGAAGTTQAGASGVDVALVFDTTGSMEDSIDDAKAAAADIVESIRAAVPSSRFALVDYRDFSSRSGHSVDYPAKVDVEFTDSADEVVEAINGLTLGHGGDTPETMFSGLHAAYGLDWRPGVKKIAIVIADARPLSPEPVSGLTADDIVRESLALDPVAVDVVNVGSASNAVVRNVVAGTDGEIYDADPEEVSESVVEAVEESARKPYAWVAGPYVGPTGTTFTLDASGSYAVDGDIVRYEWDVDGDGTYEKSTTEPTWTLRVDGPVVGVVAVRVTDSAGRTGLATSVLNVSSDGDEVAAEEDNCPKVANPGQEDVDDDGVGDVCDSTPGFPVADQPGVVDTVKLPRGAARPALTRFGVTGNRKLVKAAVTCRANRACAASIRIRANGQVLTWAVIVKAGKTMAVKAPNPRELRAKLRHRAVRYEVTLRTAGKPKVVKSFWIRPRHRG